MPPSPPILINIPERQLRVKQPTLLKKFMANQITLNTLAEEIRILYVALTRALMPILRKFNRLLQQNIQICQAFLPGRHSRHQMIISRKEIYGKPDYAEYACGGNQDFVCGADTR